MRYNVAGRRRRILSALPACPMEDRESEPKLQPGRYAAIDVGTNSVLLLVADISEDGRLTPICQQSRITRLGENVSASRALSRGAIRRTVETVAEYTAAARQAQA